MRTITYTITDLLKFARGGSFTIPLFQREFVWREGQVKLLVDSVSRNFPIGSLLVLAENAAEMPVLHARPIEAAARTFGVRDEGDISIADASRSDRMYVLDGQQRLTSLVRVFLDAVDGKSYYVDLKRLLEQFEPNGSHIWKRNASELAWVRMLNRKDPNPERCEKNRYLRSDIVLEKEKASYFVSEYFEDSHDFDGKDRAWRRAAAAAVVSVFETIRNFQVPVVVIDRDTPFEAICRIFETINSTGTRLTTFDLSVARFYPDPDLRTKWTETQQMSDVMSRFDVDGERVLQVIAVWRAFREKKTPEPTRGAMLTLPGDLINREWDAAAAALDEALLWVEGHGASRKSAPNDAILVVLAAFFGIASREWRQKTVGFSTLLEKWYFSNLLQAGGARQATNYRIGSDFTDLSKWVQNAHPPPCPRVFLSEGILLDLRPSDVRYKALQSLMALRVKYDLRTGVPLDLRDVEDHHIYPLALTKIKGIDRRRLDAITNRLYVSRETNRTLADRDPEDYMAEIAAEARKLRIESRYDQRLRDAAVPGSVSDPGFARRFSQDALNTFQKERATAILGLVREVIGDALQESSPMLDPGVDEPEDTMEDLQDE